MAKGKKKQSKKQKAASLKNLAKARKALRAKGYTGKGKKKTKSPRSASRSTHKPKPKAKKKGAITKSKSKKPAKRPGMRAAPRVPKKVRPSATRTSKPRRPHGSKQTPAQYRASLRNLAKARSARKRASKRHPVKPHSYPVKKKTVNVPKHMSWEGRSSKQSPAQRRASLANLKKARAAQKRGHRGHRGAREARASKGQTPAQRRASLRNLAKARAARKKANKRHPVSGYKYDRKAGTRHVPGHLSWEHAGYYENPLSGAELFFGGFTGLIWFMLTDFVDRVIATHDLTDKGTKDAAGHELYADNPPTTGDYAGIFNPTAICAPMNAWRWLAGVGMIVVPLGGSALISSETHPYIKASFQGAFFASTMRIGGKALIDLAAFVTMWTPFGQRLYDGEMRAQVLASSDQTPLSSLPSAGLGNPDCKCESCTTGVGACQAGVGWPSNVREVAPANEGGGQPPAPPAPPPTTSLPEPAPQTPYVPVLQGVSGVPRGNPFAWGEKEEKAA